MAKILKYQCPVCGNDTLMSVESVVKGWDITEITEDGDFDFDSDEKDLKFLNGDSILHYCCSNCHCIVADKDGQNIDDEKELVEWIKANCSQE